MDKTLIDQIKKELLERKEQILKDMTGIQGKEDEVKFPAYGDKPDENAQEVGDYVTNIATEKSLEQTLRDIESALGRIEKGTYGICKYCKQEISKERLKARPVASACVSCKIKLQSN